MRCESAPWRVAFALLVACASPARPATSRAPAPADAKTNGVAIDPSPLDASQNDASVNDAGIDAAKDAATAYVWPKDHDAWPLTTPCVDVLEDAKTRAKHAPAIEPERRDIDRDGDADWIVTTEIGKKNRRGYVYLARGSCGHFAGEWEGGQVGPVPTDDGKMTNAWEECRETNGHGPCCPRVLVRRYLWNGRTYAFRETWSDKIGCFVLEPYGR